MLAERWILLNQPKNNKYYQCQLKLDIKLTLTLDIELILNFGHQTLQLKLNHVSMSYEIVCLVGSDRIAKLTILFPKPRVNVLICICIISVIDWLNEV